MASDTPDIIVAIDLGTTYTGVAWARPQRGLVLQSPIQVIHDWPGMASRNEQKVQTCLTYNPDDSLSAWGYLCEEDDATEKSRHEFFKIFLDKQTLNAAHQAGISQAPSSVLAAKRLVTDYLREIYLHVKRAIELHTGIGHIGWQSMVVEFVFSVPTTWRTQEIINVFKDTIYAAGFGTEGMAHTATVELTESEAAAVGTIKGSSVAFRAGDMFLSVDAGGGTTDFAVMQVVEPREPFPVLSQITQVDGIGTGSALIDQAFISFIDARIDQFPELAQLLPPDCAKRLARSDKFRTMKHKFGEHVYDSPTYKIPLEGVSYNFNYAEAGIEQGKLILKREEIQALFDPHIDSITRKIQEQLEWVQMRGVNRPVNYMILSGGLGSSTYVRDRLQHELLMLPNPYAYQIRILQAPDPQLVVVKGLLLDRLQKLDSGSTPVLISRIARTSYGFQFKDLYDPHLHVGVATKKDPYDGKVYAVGQIDWLIKKGDIITVGVPITSRFIKKLDSKDSSKIWDSVIYTSDKEREQLPTNTSQGGVRQLCIVKSNLTGVSEDDLVMKRKSGVSFLKGKKYYLCKFDVKAIIGPADLRFELWFAGQRLSGNHDPLQVTWDTEGSGDGTQSISSYAS
ncbi:hypothetical protein BX600DRAFT_383457 [Xylariales sp. PMI_506]|nr:hypothetical protein BX600DRAFT_383457 [Xylariales sp. PMI_506]